MSNSKKIFKILISLSVIAAYIVIALFLPFLHAHDADTSFHDDCPACQWELQAKSDDCYTLSLVRHSCLPLQNGLPHYFQHTCILPQQIFISANLTRGPPEHLL